MLDLQPHLTGKILRTRPVHENDFEALYAAASDPLIWEQHPDPLRYKREVFQKYFDTGIESKGCLIIEDILTREVIGSSRFYNFASERKEITIGFTFLARKYWGKSANQELKHLMLSYAFRFVDTVRFDVGRENFRSRRALEKIGCQLIIQTEKALTYSLRKEDFKGLL